MDCCDKNQQQDPAKAAMNKRLEAIGWALFFIMIGGLMLVPEGKLSSEAWLIGVGVIMLGINLARRFIGIQVDKCGVIIGILALAFGISGSFGLDLPIFPILLILIGVNIIRNILFKKAKD